MTRLKLALVTFLSLSLLLASGAGAQEKKPTPAVNLKIKEIKTPSQIEDLLNIQEFIPLAKKKGIALGITVEYDGPTNLRSFLLTQNGKMKLADTISAELDSPGTIAAVWIDSAAAAGVEAAADSHGLLFFGYDADDYKSSNVFMAKFDGSGKFTEGPTNLINLTSSTSAEEVYIDSITAAKGPHSVAVAVGMETYNDDTGKSTTIARFFETDFDGNLIGGIRDVPFDANTDQYAYCYDPCWSGMYWMVPARVVEFTPSRVSTCQLFTADSMVAAAPVSATDFTIQKIYDTGSTNINIYGARFLPLYQASPAMRSYRPSDQSFDLFIYTISDIPEHTSALTTSNNTGLMQQIADTGAKLGKTKKLKRIKPWERVKTVEKDMVITNYREYYSAFTAVDNGSYLVVRTEQIERKSEVSVPPTTWLDEGHFSILHLYNKYKKVDTVAEYTLPGEQYPDYEPILEEGFGKYWVIIQTRDPLASKDYYYIATFSR